MLPKFRDGEEVEKTLEKMAEKYGRKYYDTETSRNPDAYKSQRSKGELRTFATFEYGYAKAREMRPDLVKSIDTVNRYLDQYNNECRNVSSKLLGKYGNIKLYKAKEYSVLANDAVNSMLTSMARRNLKYR